MYNYEDELKDIEDKYRLIRDRVLGVALGYDHALFLWGKGGTGKSWTVENTLKKSGKPWSHYNSDISEVGLFEQLKEYYNHIILLEDMEQLMKKPKAIGILRSATEGNRKVTRTINKGKDEFIFEGGIIYISNDPPGAGNPMQALASRMNPLEFNPTHTEMIAMMYNLSWEFECNLSSNQRMETFDYCLKYAKTLSEKALNLRLIISALKARERFEKGQLQTNWKLYLDSYWTGKVKTGFTQP